MTCCTDALIRLWRCEVYIVFGAHVVTCAYTIMYIAKVQHITFTEQIKFQGDPEDILSCYTW